MYCETTNANIYNTLYINVVKRKNRLDTNLLTLQVITKFI